MHVSPCEKNAGHGSASNHLSLYQTCARHYSSTNDFQSMLRLIKPQGVGLEDVEYNNTQLVHIVSRYMSKY